MAEGFEYPIRGNFSTENDNRMINVLDDLFLEYTTTWSALNLTILCLKGTLFGWTNVDDNPILSSGTYHFGSIESHNMAINDYPTPCYFKLTEYGDNENQLSGQSFWVTSNTESSTSFSPTPSSTTSTSTTSTSSDTVTSQPTTDTATVPSRSSSSPTATVSQTSAPSTPSALSAGAAAGIGVGVGLAVIILAAVIIFIYFKRRKPATATPAIQPEHAPSDAAKFERYSQYQQQDTQEMDAPRRPAELEYAQNDVTYRHELS